jgi:diguanylate cyclase (GGDEF)-like protein
MMPEIDGYDVCQFFKKDPELRFTRILVLSARDSTEARVKAYRAGADLFLSKPFEIEELREMIHTALNSKTAYEQLLGDYRSQSINDPDLQCFNWRYMESRISEELKRVDRNGRPFSVLMMDLDQFQHVVSYYGQQFSNEVLRNVVDAMKEEIRESDLVGRHTDDSFVLLLPETPEKGAKSAALRIQEVVSSLVFVKRRRFSVRATAVSLTVEKSTSLEELMGKLLSQLKRAHERKLGKL